MVFEELVDEFNVRIEDIPRSFFQPRQMAERGNGKPITRHRADSAKQIIEACHTFGKLGLAQDPTAAKPTQPVTLGQTASRDERGTQASDWRPGIGKNVAIGLVHHHASTRFLGYRSHFSNNRRINDNATRIVRAGYDYETRPW